MSKRSGVIKICDGIVVCKVDQFSWTSKVKSVVERVCPHSGHLFLYGLTTSFTDFNIFMLAIFFPHLPQITSTDMWFTVFQNN